MFRLDSVYIFKYFPGFCYIIGFQILVVKLRVWMVVRKVRTFFGGKHLKMKKRRDGNGFEF